MGPGSLTRRRGYNSGDDTSHGVEVDCTPLPNVPSVSGPLQSMRHPRITPNVSQIVTNLERNVDNLACDVGDFIFR